MKNLYIIGCLLLLLSVQGCGIIRKVFGQGKKTEPAVECHWEDKDTIRALCDSISGLWSLMDQLELENKAVLSVGDSNFYESVVKSSDSNQTGYYKRLVGLLSAIQKYNNNDAVVPGDGYIEIDMDTVQILCDSIAGLQNRIAELENISEAVKAVQNINDAAFFKSIIKAPLSEKYDSVRVGYYKQLVELFDYKGNDELKGTYILYYPLLENYGKWNAEIANFIESVLWSFKYSSPYIDTEKKRFEKKLDSCEYYCKYRWKKDPQVNFDYDKFEREIKYLTDVIEETMSLFEDPSKFKKENFEEQLRKLK